MSTLHLLHFRIVLDRINSMRLLILCSLFLYPFLPTWATDEPLNDYQAIKTQQITQQEEQQQLISKIQNEGKAKVIIELNVPSVMTQQLSHRTATRDNSASKHEFRKKIAQVQDQVLKRLNKSQSLSKRLARFFKTWARSSSVTKKVTKFKYIQYMAMEVDAEELQQLQSDPEIKAVYEDTVYYPTLKRSTPKIGARSECDSGNCGAGQTIAILDTPFDISHDFFKDRILHEAEACFSAKNSKVSTLCRNGKTVQKGYGASWSSNDNYCDHGTHVAGIAAGNSGVAPEANLIPIQVFHKNNSGHISAYSSNIMLGLEHVYELRDDYNIAAVNLSLGGGKHTSDTCRMHDAFKLLESADIAVVAASGNNGYTDALSWPACVSNVISVGATTISDTVANFSNSAAFLDILAPGVYITSSTPGSYKSFSGTSMAAPHVTGAFALIRSAHPNATVDQMLTALKTTGVPIRDRRNGITFPRIQVDDAIASLNAINLPPEVHIQSPANTATVVAGEAVTFTATASDDSDGDLSHAITWRTTQHGNLLDSYEKPITHSTVTVSGFCAGQVSVTASATDRQSQVGHDEISLQIDPIADPSTPVVIDDFASTSQQIPVEIDVLANDVAIGADTIHGISTYSQGQYGAVTETQQGLTYSPDEGFTGTDTFSYSVITCLGGETTATVTVTVDPVHQPPVVQGDKAQTGINTAVTIAVLANDVDDSSLRIVSVSEATQGSVEYDADTLTYTPNPGFSGSDSFSYTVENDFGARASATVTVSVVGATAAILHVPGDYAHIQDAIDAATDGDTVLVARGRYEEHLNFAGKDIVLRSEAGSKNTIIAGNTDNPDCVVNIGPLGTLSGFTITGGEGHFEHRNAPDCSNGAPIYVHGDGSIIQDNRITANQGPISGIYGHNAAPIIEQNYFTGNSCGIFKHWTGGVIIMKGLSSPTIQNNWFVSNECTAVNLPQLLPGSAPRVINNTFTHNTVAVTTYSSSEAPQTYRNNILYDNEVGVQRFKSRAQMPIWRDNNVYGNETDYLRMSNQTGLNGNISEDPLLRPTDSESDYYHLNPDSPAH